MAFRRRSIGSRWRWKYVTWGVTFGTKYKEHERDSYIAARLVKDDKDLRFGVIAVFVSNGAFQEEEGPSVTLEETGHVADREARESEVKRTIGIGTLTGVEGKLCARSAQPRGSRRPHQKWPKCNETMRSILSRGASLRTRFETKTKAHGYNWYCGYTHDCMLFKNKRI